MPRLDHFLTDNSAAEDAQAAWESANEKLDAAITDCGDDAKALADLLVEVLGKKAAEALRDVLASDADSVTDAVMRWAA